MNYQGPKQRESDRRWDYCNSNKRTGTFAIGYCRAWIQLSSENTRFLSPVQCEEENWRLEPWLSKFHSTGHATEEEACACYKEYLLDHEFQVRKYEDRQHKCRICDKWTQTGVEVGYVFFANLCSEHATRAEVSKLFQVHTSFGSL